MWVPGDQAATPTHFPPSRACAVAMKAAHRRGNTFLSILRYTKLETGAKRTLTPVSMQRQRLGSPASARGPQRHSERFSGYDAVVRLSEPPCGLPKPSRLRTAPPRRPLPLSSLPIRDAHSFISTSPIPPAANPCPTPSPQQSLVAPHIESYNFFLEDGLREAVDDLPPQVMQVRLGSTGR